jgi:polyisoprenoid-binding protein YceI
MHGRATTRILVGVAVLAVAGFVGAYFLFFSDDSPPPLTLSNTATTATGGQGSATTAAAADVAGMWRVASGSQAGYRVREKLTALPAQSDAVGRTTAVNGQVRVDGAGGGVTATDVRFEVDVAKLQSDETRRDNAIRTRGLETNRFPTATFVSSEPIRLSNRPPVGQKVSVQAVGDMTIHGVTKRVTIPIEAQLSGNRIELVGSYKFPMSDFGIDPPSVANVVTVEPDATLEFQIFLEKA